MLSVLCCTDEDTIVFLLNYNYNGYENLPDWCRSHHFGVVEVACLDVGCHGYRDRYCVVEQKIHDVASCGDDGFFEVECSL